MPLYKLYSGHSGNQGSIICGMYHFPLAVTQTLTLKSVSDTKNSKLTFIIANNAVIENIMAIANSTHILYAVLFYTTVTTDN